MQRLPEYQSIDEKLIKYSDKDKRISLPFITHNLRVYSTSIELQRLYPGIKLFTKRDLAGQKHFPDHLPDAFVSLKVKGNNKPYRYFLDLIPDGEPRYKIDTKIADYDEFFDEEDDYWGTTKNPLPVMLLLCESGSFERRLQKQVVRQQHALDSNELEYLTSTLVALKNARAEEKDIWSNIEDPDELVALR